MAQVDGVGLFEAKPGMQGVSNGDILVFKSKACCRVSVEA